MKDISLYNVFIYKNIIDMFGRRYSRDGRLNYQVVDRKNRVWRDGRCHNQLVKNYAFRQVRNSDNLVRHLRTERLFRRACRSRRGSSGSSGSRRSSHGHRRKYRGGRFDSFRFGGFDNRDGGGRYDSLDRYDKYDSFDGAGKYDGFDDVGIGFGGGRDGFNKNSYRFDGRYYFE